MKLLVVTNLYPPQELGGYGRSMADFAWGLQQRGHSIHVLCSDAPYLGAGGEIGPSAERVHRVLQLKGTYQGGIQPLQNPQQLEAIERANIGVLASIWDQHGPFDGALVGNLDLLGLSLLRALLQLPLAVIHHIGFVQPPFPAEEMPRSSRYRLVGASQAVVTHLRQAGLAPQLASIPVVYPGVRCDCFGPPATPRPLPAPLDGSDPPNHLGTAQHPLKVCFAGLLMGSKGAHTLVEAMVLLQQQGIVLEGHLAGGSFQAGYKDHLQLQLERHGLADAVRFVGQLKRDGLARFFRLHHACVFPSIHPEAFGIVGAEAMTSGLVLLSSGVGGSAELFEDQISGLRFAPGQAHDLAAKLMALCKSPAWLQSMAREGEIRARQTLSVLHSAHQLEVLFQGA